MLIGDYALDSRIVETKGVIGPARYALIVRIGIISLGDNIVSKAFSFVARIINYLDSEDA